jgi:hypothetical protein
MKRSVTSQQSVINTEIDISSRSDEEEDGIQNKSPFAEGDLLPHALPPPLPPPLPWQQTGRGDE